MIPTRGNGRPRRRAVLSTATLVLLAGAVIVTSGTAAALLTGAVGSSSTPVVQSATGQPCPQKSALGGGSDASVELAASLTPTTLPVVVSRMYPTAGLPEGGTPVTITGSGFGEAGNQNLWSVFDFGYNAAGADVLVTDETVVVDDGTIDIPGTPSEPDEQTTLKTDPVVYLVTPDAYVLTTTEPWLKLPPSQWIEVGTFLYTNTPPPTTTTTVPPTTTTTTVPPTTTTTVPAVYAPIINALDPPVGIPTGGTVVAIVGTDLAGATSVMFGATPATSFTVVNAGMISAVAPGGTGTVQVAVTTPAGTSAPTENANFTFTSLLPAVKSLKAASSGGCLSG